MQYSYRARWMPKSKIDLLRRTGQLHKSVVVNSCKGFILVDPHGSEVRGGEAISRYDAKFELDAAWCSDPPQTIKKARDLLGL